MSGKIVHEVAELLYEAAIKAILQKISSGQDPMIVLRGSLMYALISCEISNGATCEDIVCFVNKLYDILNHSDTSQSNLN